MKLKIAFYTFGCRMNQAETSTIRQSFEEKNYRIVDYRENPHVVVVNTCTVTENGDADTRRLVNKINRANPQTKIALIGCQAQVQKKKLIEMKGVNWVIGNNDKMDFLKILEKGGLNTPQVITPTIQRKNFTMPVPGIDRNRTRANLKIQDGCNFFCSFCEIPYARGRARSREFGDILKEAKTLTIAGHRELVLTGINIGTYSYEDKGILDVISALEDIEDLWRIRISSIEPTTIPFGILTGTRENNKLCRYLHIPIQSGNDKILKIMKRNYTIEEYFEYINFAVQAIPDLCLGTDVIVGFPGETEVDFEETYDVLLKSRLAYFHVFSYSDRQYSKSAGYRDKVPAEKIKERSRRLRELSYRKRNFYLSRSTGKIQNVLFEQKKNSLWTGLTDNYIRVKVKSEMNLFNQLLPVRLSKVENQTMLGELV